MQVFTSGGVNFTTCCTRKTFWQASSNRRAVLLGRSVVCASKGIWAHFGHENATLQLKAEGALPTLFEYLQRRGQCTPIGSTTLMFKKLKIFFSVTFGVRVLLFLEIIIDPQEVVSSSMQQNAESKSEIEQSSAEQSLPESARTFEDSTRLPPEANALGTNSFRAAHVHGDAGFVRILSRSKKLYSVVILKGRDTKFESSSVCTGVITLVNCIMLNKTGTSGSGIPYCVIDFQNAILIDSAWRSSTRVVEKRKVSWMPTYQVINISSWLK